MGYPGGRAAINFGIRRRYSLNARRRSRSSATLAAADRPGRRRATLSRSANRADASFKNALARRRGLWWAVDRYASTKTPSAMNSALVGASSSDLGLGSIASPLGRSLNFRAAGEKSSTTRPQVVRNQSAAARGNFQVISIYSGNVTVRGEGLTAGHLSKNMALARCRQPRVLDHHLRQLAVRYKEGFSHG